MIALVLLLLALPSTSFAQRRIPISGDRLSGVVLPVEPLAGDITIEARRARTWTVDDTKRLLLQDDVTIDVAGHRFESQSAVVWLNRLPSEDGLINQIAIYFNEIENPRSRAGLGVHGENLLVTASARGGVRMTVVLAEQDKPSRSALVRQAEDRLEAHLRRVVGEPQRLAGYPQIDRPAPEPEFIPRPGEAVPAEELDLPTEIELPDPMAETPWLRDPEAMLSFIAEQIQVLPGENENAIVATGSLVVEYFADNRSADLSQFTLSAERAVIFTDPGTLREMAAWTLPAERVRGIYLEGNVVASANDGAYVVRSPRVYYDFRTQRAVMVDAVLRTYTRQVKAPVYVRATELRQIAENQWQADGVRVSTSEFAVPHLAIGASTATVTQRPDDPNDPTDAETYFDAKGLTLRAGGMPIFGWPSFSGQADEIPLRSLTVGSSSNTGVEVETRWDLFSLLGVERPEGTDLELKVDGYTERGAGGGLEFEYAIDQAYGAVDLYGLWDDGTDRTSSGLDVEQDEAFRGVALFEQQWDLTRFWSLDLQGSFISDETFITSWREEDFRERRQYETSAYLKYQKRRFALTLLAKYAVNDFISNDWLLASQQYQVDKLPELTLRSYGLSWFDDTVTYSTESRASRVRLALSPYTPDEYGVRGRAFGIPNDERLDRMFLDANLPTKYYSRFDTRHEFALPTQWGPVDITPFIVGRATIYDDDFVEYSGEDDKYRLFGAAGITLNTQFHHVDNAVENRLLDLHRLRHIVEPSMTVWYGYATVDQGDLPVYDPEVESLATGAAVRFGLHNTWQTERGGPGYWRSVDVLRIDADVVLTSSDTDRESPTPDWFDYRPEYSQMGDHVQLAGAWQLSDTLALTGQTTYDLDESELARGSIGAELRHSPIFTTYVEYRTIEVSDNELLDVGWIYRLTPKYRVNLRPQWDLREEEFRAVTVQVVRSFPDFDFEVRVRRDEIQDETSFGASIGLVNF